MDRDSLRVWRNRAFVVATVITIILIWSHPELRLLIPLIDVMGIDIFLAVVGIQFWASIRPFVVEAYRRAGMPLAVFFYRAIIFTFGYMGPYVDARISVRRFGFRAEA